MREAKAPEVISLNSAVGTELAADGILVAVTRSSERVLKVLVAVGQSIEFEGIAVICE